MSATAGMERKRALTTHQFVFGPPVLFSFSPMIVAAKPPRTPMKAIRRAMSPRVKHPRTSTGVETTRKNRAGRIDGSMRCKMSGFISVPREF